MTHLYPGAGRITTQEAEIAREQKNARRRARAPLEDAIQQEFVTWIRGYGFKGLELRFWHTPNERQGKTARLRQHAMGVLPGVSDFFITARSLDFDTVTELVIEFKRPGEKPSDDQKDFLAFMRRCGRLVLVAYSAEEAKDFVLRVLYPF